MRFYFVSKDQINIDTEVDSTRNVKSKVKIIERYESFEDNNMFSVVIRKVHLGVEAKITHAVLYHTYGSKDIVHLFDKIVCSYSGFSHQEQVVDLLKRVAEEITITVYNYLHSIPERKK